ncbi:RHTO0S07e04478g1_1 [Rhodotorula toruloides]|uniref:RHTO0S07e04478g1_1 n=1 Tax=Rhodotorula toruloides TaxID=5286 RepID=A0A061B566_RHOTO|nr:RHTO0S07e04478g1_1 [Rhodotorula toruloides]
MLVAIGKVAAAYELGERHRDFDSLVHLSNDPTHGSSSRSARTSTSTAGTLPSRCTASTWTKASCGRCSSRKRRIALCLPLSSTQPTVTSSLGSRTSPSTASTTPVSRSRPRRLRSRQSRPRSSCCHSASSRKPRKSTSWRSRARRCSERS